MTHAARWVLALASVAVAFAAADTYVVVLALPDMMTSTGIPIDQLQRAAPIVSGFLLGYVAMLPLIGRITDLRGRLPVLVAALVVFSVGSALTAVAYDLPSMVSGRFLQGVGGGGLVPATLALVADLYPVERRGVPLGIVSAVQEIGSVLGPLFGAVVLAWADWRAIFWINLLVGVVLAVALRTIGRGTDPDPDPTPTSPPGRRDWLSMLLVAATAGAGWLVFTEPDRLMRDLTWGQLFIPFLSGHRWTTPIALVTLCALGLLLLRSLTAARPLLDLRGWWQTLRAADLPGATLLAVALGGVILAFATADPEIQVFSEWGVGYLAVAAVATALFAWHLRRAQDPLVPRGALSRTPAWGSLLVSFFIGAALIAALIDIPIFARSTAYPDSQLMAALVLLRFLVALPVGAVLGGYALRRLPAGPVTAVGMLLAAVGFGWMSTWGVDVLDQHVWSTIPLVLGGLGFGLALAPVNAAVLATTEDAVHGVASALVVVARMVGMLVGISALTTVGLRRFYAAQDGIPPIQEVCEGSSRCSAYNDLLLEAAISQQHAVFQGAAVSAVVAAVLALVLFRGAQTRGLDTGELLRVGG